VLWQLFHYVPLNMDGWQRMTEHHTTEMQWQVGEREARGQAALQLTETGRHRAVVILVLTNRPTKSICFIALARPMQQPTVGLGTWCLHTTRGATWSGCRWAGGREGLSHFGARHWGLNSQGSAGCLLIQV
jgi:hypothetical protein